MAIRPVGRHDEHLGKFPLIGYGFQTGPRGSALDRLFDVSRLQWEVGRE